MANDFDNERSSLWSVAAVGALGTGLGFSLLRSKQSIANALSYGNTNIAANVSNLAAEIPGFNTGHLLKTFQDIPASGINLLSANVIVDPNYSIARAAYQAALSTGNVSQNNAYNIFKNILGQADPHAAYAQAKVLVSENLGDVGVLTEQLSNLINNETLSASRRSSAISTPAGFNSFRDTLSEASLPSDILKQNQFIRGQFANWGQRVGANVDWKGTYLIEDILEGTKKQTYMLQGSIGNELINIPLNDTGLTYSGQNLVAKYATRSGLTPEGNIKSYTEEILRAYQAAFESTKTEVDFKTAARRVGFQVIENMNERDSAHRALAIWHAPEPFMLPGSRVKQLLNLSEVVYDENNFNMDQMDSILKRGNVFAFGSPETVAKGVFTRRNLASDLYGSLGSLITPDQRPTQFIREEFAATTRAKELAAKTSFGSPTFDKYFSRLDPKLATEEYRKLINAGQEATSSSAYSAPQLMTFYAKKEQYDLPGGIGELLAPEEIAIRESAKDLYETERIAAKTISLEEGLSTNKGIVATLQGKQVGDYVSFEGLNDKTRETYFGSNKFTGQYIGVESLTGKELYTDNTDNMSSRIIGAQLVGEGKAKVFLKETYSMDKNQIAKLFSLDVKSMGGIVPDKTWGDISSRLGFSELNSVEQVSTGKLLQRNKAALLTQQIEALGFFASKKIDAGALGKEAMALTESFLADPEQSLKIKTLLSQGHSLGVEKIQENMVSLGRTIGLSESELGMTFGLMDQNLATKFGIGEAVAASKGVIGLSKGRIGDFGFTSGAGGLASIEHTGARALAMQGELGQRFVSELGGRIQGGGNLIAADKMLESVTNSEDFINKTKSMFSKTDIPNIKDVEELVGDTGRYVSLGSRIKAFNNADKIYIPGRVEAPGMYQTMNSSSGELVKSPIERSLEDLRYSIAKNKQPETEAAAQELLGNISRYAETQAGVKGKVVGSAYLTGMQSTLSESANNVIKISPSRAQSMYKDLIDRATSPADKRYIEDQMKLAMAGETTPIAMWRHPTTGPQSLQFASMQIDKRLTDDVVMIPQRRGELNIGGVSQIVDTSQMVGMKGDFDKDMFNVALISNKTTADMAKNHLTNTHNAEYTKYLFNHYAVKGMIDQTSPVAPKGQIIDDVILAQQQGARDLVTAKIATPKVNLALQKLKIGIGAVSPEKYSSMAPVLWHLEEAAITKHGSRAGEFYEELSSAINKRDSGKFGQLLEQTLGPARTITGSLDGNQLSYSFNPKEFADDAINAVSSVSEDVDLAYASARATKGHTQLTTDEVLAIMNSRRSGSIDPALSAVTGRAYGKETLSNTLNRQTRTIKSKVKGILGAISKNKTPLMIGAAAAAGIMLAAPSISGELSPRTIDSGRNVRSEDLGPPDGLQMTAPQPRIMRSPTQYDISGLKSSSNANIRMKMSDSDASRDNFMRNARQLNGNVRIKTTDDRRSLSPHTLANKIHERL